MTVEQTQRGFALVRFEDRYGVECTIQKSSLATEDAIWFGAKEIGLKRFTSNLKPGGKGWEDVELENIHPEGPYYSANNRMHLTREQVAALLPILQRFVDTGEVSDV